jgi:hypothetical protein
MGRSYRIIQLTDGFRVEAEPDGVDTPDQAPGFREFLGQHGHLRVPVTVLLRPTHFEIEPHFDPVQGVGRTNLLAYRTIVTSVASTLMSRWAPRIPVVGEASYVCLRRWALENTRKGIGKRIHAEWRRLLGRADPTVVAVQRKVFSATIGYEVHPLLFSPELYNQRWVVSDLLRFRAAASLFVYPDLKLEDFSDWRKTFFCPDGCEPYAALHKTLHDLPGGVPVPLLAELKMVRLPRPITSRLELITTLLAGGWRARNFRVFAWATEGEIRKVMRKVSLSVLPDREDLFSPRRAADVAKVVRYLADYPELHRGHLTGLAEKAGLWHRRDRQEEIRRDVYERIGPDTPTARPPVPPPQDAGVRLLATVGEVLDEGHRMGHCIASLAESARDGRCYLFHVESGGESASVEVSPQGFVVQAQGPRNTQNRAAAHGCTLLSAWARQLADTGLPW